MGQRQSDHVMIMTVYLLLAGIGILIFFNEQENVMAAEHPSRVIELPAPKFDGTVPLERALAQRRSVRSFEHNPLTLEEVGQLVWAAQGISSNRGYRTAPSAGATYPLIIYVSVGNVDSLQPGIYRYRPRENTIW